MTSALDICTTLIYKGIICKIGGKLIIPLGNNSNTGKTNPKMGNVIPAVRVFLGDIDPDKEHRHQNPKLEAIYN